MKRVHLRNSLNKLHIMIKERGQMLYSQGKKSRLTYLVLLGVAINYRDESQRQET